MQGQLWQECPRCHAEPVCVDCERCETHCRCERDAQDRQQIADVETAHPGLLQRVAEHHEHGRREH
jgi:hypothetical protein